MSKEKSPDVAPEYKPRLHIDLPKGQTDVIEALKVGQKVTFTVTGEVVSLEMREDMYDGKKTETARFCVEDFKVKFKGKNVYADLAEDDE